MDTLEPFVGISSVHRKWEPSNFQGEIPTFIFLKHPSDPGTAGQADPPLAWWIPRRGVAGSPFRNDDFTQRIERLVQQSGVVYVGGEDRGRAGVKHGAKARQSPRALVDRATVRRAEFAP